MKKNLISRIVSFVISIFLVVSAFNIFSIEAKAASGKMPVISYTSHVQSFGWSSAVSNGTTSGTTGLGKRIEAISISVDVNGVMNSYGKQITGGIRYKAHVQGIGWMDWKEAKSNSRLVDGNNFVGTTGKRKRLEAIQIELTGELANEYDVLYCAHVQSYGWSNWTRNGAVAGSVGHGKRLEALKIKLLRKSKTVNASLSYNVHAQSKGWMPVKYVGVGDTSASTIAGTIGQGKRMEAINLNLACSGVSGYIRYSTHVQSKGWTDFVTDGKTSGTVGQSKRIEAIKINILGDISAYYDIYYRVHVQKHGWLDWAKNGQEAGTVNGGLRMEAIQAVLVPKDAKAPGSTNKPFIKEKPKKMTWKDYPGELSIEINKEANCVTIYKGEKPIRACICSTGAATPLGIHHIGRKWRWQELMGKVYGQYCSQIDGDVLFHSVPYNSIDIYDLSVYMYNQLGTQASHGCVRLTTIDAKWIYDNCPSGTEVIVYESPDPGPLGKPEAETLPYDHTWDPTDPAID